MYFLLRLIHVDFQYTWGNDILGHDGKDGSGKGDQGSQDFEPQAEPAIGHLDHPVGTGIVVDPNLVFL